MQCKNPITLKIKEYPHERVVPCGNCGQCLQNRRDEWCFRISEEYKVCHSAWFVTLTYSDLHVPWKNFLVEGVNCQLQSLSKRDVQSFMKRLRQRIARSEHKDLPKMKYYLVGEYGSRTRRPHYHAILFNAPKDVAEKIPEIWNKGNVHIGQVTDASINYTLKYIVENDKGNVPKPLEKPFAHMSKGIGEGFVKKNLNRKKDYVLQNGYKKSTPRYYREKIFSDGQKLENAKNKRRLAMDSYEKLYNKYKLYDNPDRIINEMKESQSKRILDKSKKSKL